VEDERRGSGREEPPSIPPAGDRSRTFVFHGSNIAIIRRRAQARTWQETADGLYFRLQLFAPAVAGSAQVLR
jgi:hypothetical protein